MVNDDIQVGPGTELPLPVGDGGEWGNYEKGRLDSNAMDFF